MDVSIAVLQGRIHGRSWKTTTPSQAGRRTTLSCPPLADALLPAASGHLPIPAPFPSGYSATSKLVTH
jgi:hypothetical protein